MGQNLFSKSYHYHHLYLWLRFHLLTFWSFVHDLYINFVTLIKCDYTYQQVIFDDLYLTILSLKKVCLFLLKVTYSNQHMLLKLLLQHQKLLYYLRWSLIMKDQQINKIIHRKNWSLKVKCLIQLRILIFRFRVIAVYKAVVNHHNSFNL